MGLIYEKILRKALFLQDPERTHEYATKALETLARFPRLCALMAHFNSVAGAQPIELFGLRFPNTVGLAAGFDKNAKFWRAAAALGFGHVEIGTVTNHKQPGNPRPRLFRYPEQEAIINRMGFNNDGAAAVAQRLSKAVEHPIPLGVNIGKSKAAPLEAACEDYLASFHRLADFADYITINVSSPNTPGLRELQGNMYLPNLLKALSLANQDRAHKLGVAQRPMLVKIAPDLSFEEIDSILETLLDLGYHGIIATNTSTDHSSVPEAKEGGGLSGRPLHARSVKIINYIHRATSGKLPIIGVGGIMDAKSCGEIMDAGASLVQIYTGMIYRGPFFAKELANAMAWHHKSWV